MAGQARFRVRALTRRAPVAELARLCFFVAELARICVPVAERVRIWLPARCVLGTMGPWRRS